MKTFLKTLALYTFNLFLAWLGGWALSALTDIPHNEAWIALFVTTLVGSALHDLKQYWKEQKQEEEK